jgi:membrane protein implicated in regulation of membrane protease activity
MEVWHMWAVAALLLLVLEVFTSGFVLACIGVAAVGGALAAGLGASLAGQTVAAALLGAVSFFALRPLALRRFMGAGGLSTGTDALIGRTVTLSAPLDPQTGHAECRIDGDVWRLRAADPALPLDGANRVRITGIDGNTLLATPL